MELLFPAAPRRPGNRSRPQRKEGPACTSGSTRTTHPIAHPDGQPIYPIVGCTRRPTGHRGPRRRISTGVQWYEFDGGCRVDHGIDHRPLGIIFRARRVVADQSDREGGRGLAIAGLILGYLGLAAWIALIIFYASLSNGPY